MKSTGVVRRIDDLGRIVLPKEIRKTLRIREGESLEIYTNGEEIVLKKFTSSSDLKEISQNLIDTITNTIKNSILVADRDNIIAGSGPLKKEFISKHISSKLENILLNNEKTSKYSVEYKEIIESDNKSNKIFDYLVNPILSEGEVIGLILIIDVHTGKMFSEEQEHMAQIISQFLEKYLEEWINLW